MPTDGSSYRLVGPLPHAAVTGAGPRVAATVIAVTRTFLEAPA